MELLPLAAKCNRRQTSRRYHGIRWSAAMIGISWRHAGLPAAAEYNEFAGNSGHQSFCHVLSGCCLVPRSSLITHDGNIQTLNV